MANYTRMEIIKSRNDKLHYLSEMIDFNGSKSMGTANDWSNLFIKLTIDYPTAWTIYHNEDHIDENYYVDKYIQKYGRWKHGNHNINAGHNELGMAYSEWVQETNKLQEFGLGDSPDFSAKCGNNRVQGDIGGCTPIAFHNGIRSLGWHDLWITVFGLNTQLIIEFSYWVGFLYSSLISYGIECNSNLSIENDVKDIFFCPIHNVWTIDNKSRNKLYKYFGHTGEKIGIPAQMEMNI